MMILYRSLLRLYPAKHRHEFFGEMCFVFTQAREQVSNETAAVRLSFYSRELRGDLRGAVREHVRQIFGYDRWMPIKETPMRPQFRFPRLTVFFMALSFALVMAVIHEAKIIQQQYAPNDAVAPVWLTLPSTLAILFLIALVIVAIVLAALLTLHRSGVQRLENLRPWLNSESQSKK